TASTAVVRVSKLAVPRLDMKPAPPPTPSPPPSDFCSSTVAIMAPTIIRWTTITTVCISPFRRKPGDAGVRLHWGLRGLKWRGVTRLGGALSPPAHALPLARDNDARSQGHRPLSGWPPRPARH